MYNLVSSIIVAMLDLTNNLEQPNSIAFPIAHYNILHKTRFADGSGVNLMTELKNNFPYITRWLQIAQLKDVTPRPSGGAGATNCILLWNYDVNKASIEQPMPFTQEDPEKRNLAYKIDCWSRYAGLITPYPLSLSITEEC